MSASTGLSARNVTVRYGGVVANSDVSIDVEPGQVVGLIGPNGAGKTSFVDALTGFARCSGEITMGGRSLDHLRPHGRRAAGLSRTWQAGELFASLTVGENVLAGARPVRLSTLFSDLFRRHDHGTALVREALHVVGLDGMENVRAGDLTLGQQKLVGVARALAGGADVLLLDEPAAGLDSRESQEFAERLRHIVSDGQGGVGPGALLIDHDMSLVLSVCDKIYVLEFGKIIFAGTPEQARHDPAVVAAYLGVPVEAGS